MSHKAFNHFLAMAALQVAALRFAYGEPADAPFVNPSSSPAMLTVCGNRLYFSADDGVHGRELWSSNVDGECALVADLNSGSRDSNPTELTPFGGRLYFVASTFEDGVKARCWDPAEQKTALAVDYGPHLGSPSNLKFVVAGQVLYLFAVGSESEGSVWYRTSGNADFRNLHRFNKVTRLDGEFLPLNNGTLLFSIARILSKVDFHDGSPSDPENLGIPLTNRLFRPFPSGSEGLIGVLDDAHGSEPWVSDGTLDGTHLLKDICTGECSSNVDQVLPHEDYLYFSANDGIHGSELWRSDGTADGTVLVKDINPGPASSMPYHLQSVGKKLFFVANDGEHGEELWVSDDTSEGTHLVCDLFPGTEGSKPWSPVSFHDRLFFCANTPEYGEEILSSDGTPEGTRLLADIVPGSVGSSPGNLTVFGGKLFFTCDDGIHGEELWLSDGTTDGTRMAFDIATPPNNPSSSPSQLTAFGDKLLFAARDLEHGEELWISDGSEEGTIMLRDIVPGPAGSQPRAITVFKDKAFFTALAPASGRERWMTSGTPDGTQKTGEGPPDAGTPAGNEGQSVEMGTGSHLAKLNGETFLVTRTEALGAELWKTNGTPEGTVLVCDILPGPASSGPRNLVAVTDSLYFVAENQQGFAVLWSTRGTASTTHEVLCSHPGFQWPALQPYEMAAFHGNLILSLDIPRRGPVTGIGLGIVRRRGESEEFEPLPVVPRTLEDWPKNLTPVSDGLFFTLDDGIHGEELWVTDGTQAGTHLVKDILAGTELHGR